MNGVLIVNLGTPSAPTTSAVRTYLREFLSDEHLISLPKPLWWLLLNTVILPLRPKKSAKLYQQIWTAHGSPLLCFSQQLTEKLQAALHPLDMRVRLGMRYGEPSLQNALVELRQSQIKELFILPLYPQYSGVTSASAIHKIKELLMQMNWNPKIHWIKDYHTHPYYIDAISQQIKTFLSTHASLQKLIFSFHGLPEKNVKRGDPYYEMCHATSKLVAQQLQLKQHEWQVTFQSRLGPKWVKPYTQETLQTLPQQGITSVAVVCPGFAVDCLETLEEINIRNRQFFLNAGGEVFHYIPALNDSVSHVELLKTLTLTLSQKEINYFPSNRLGEGKENYIRSN
jgi:protoporphyrin/coproporphyrin ferrochelatase